ncbi:hypothetical protein AH06_218 [Erwinia phage AH06]|nr:hypothetical protein AH06_218 [Erwinia phage AH06]
MRMGNVECGLPRIAARLSCGDKSSPFKSSVMKIHKATLIAVNQSEPENEGFEQDSDSEQFH